MSFTMGVTVTYMPFRLSVITLSVVMITVVAPLKISFDLEAQLTFVETNTFLFSLLAFGGARVAQMA